MATKFQQYSALAQRQAEQVTRGRGNWTGFLDTAARLYKYPFPEQLMIYAQRPDATACAPIETWNTPMNRWVRRGSRGIALIDDTGERPRLKYVFDVADTEPSRQNARKPFLWELRQEHEGAALEALSKIYGDVEGDLGEALCNIANQLAQEYYTDNAREIGYSAEGSFLEDYDELGVTFRQALTVSVSYSLLSRCGIDADEYLEDEDFQPVFDFNTPAAVYTLGSAVSDLSQQVLRDIEVTIKRYERQQSVERQLAAERNVDHERDTQRDHLQPAGGLSAPQHSSGATGPAGERDAVPGDIRQDAPDLPERVPADTVQHLAAERDAVQPPAGDRADGGAADDPADAGTGAAEPAPGQGPRPDGVGPAQEQPAAAGGGEHPARPDLQLNAQPETPPAQEIPDPGGVSASLEDNLENSGAAEPAVAVTEPPAPLATALLGTPFTLEQADAILRDGSNQRRSVLHIAAYYMKSKPLADSAAFLVREYEEGGKGFQFGEQQVSVWFDETGLTLGSGKTALLAENQAHLSWEQAAVRVGELLEAGQYLPADVLDEAIDNERRELAERLIFFYRDDLRDVAEYPPQFVSDENTHPADVEWVKNLLDDGPERTLLVERVEEDIAALLADTETPHRRWHDPHRMLQDTLDSQIPPRTFPAQETVQTLGHMPFITDDEVDSFFQRRGHYVDGKYTILSYFLQHNDPGARTKFIKDHYGNGGGSHALCGADNSWYDGMGSSLKLTRGGLSNPYDEVALSWSAVAKRIDTLIRAGRYLTAAERESIPDYERRQLARAVANFYYNLPDDVARPFQSDGDSMSDHDRDAVLAMLNDPAGVDALLASMQPILEGTHPDDRYYPTRNNGYTMLTAYKEGTYTLFPGLELLPAAAREQAASIEEIPEQFSLFSPRPEEPSPLPMLRGVEEQREWIEQQIPEEPTPAQSPQEVIDSAIIEWNGDPESKRRVQAYMLEHGRERAAAAFLRQEYGDGLPAFPVAGAQFDLPWPKVQRQLAGLIAADRFLAEDERQSVQEQTNSQTGNTLEPESGAVPTTADLGAVDADLLDVLRNGLLDGERRAGVLELLADGAGNPQIANYLYQSYGNDSDTMTLETGDAADYFISPEGVRVEIQDKFRSKLWMDWSEIAPVVQALAAEWARLPEPTYSQTGNTPEHSPEPTSSQDGNIPGTPDAASPPPVFFPDWRAAQGDFDLDRYGDRDVIGYDKDGVEYAVGRSGSFAYITQTSSITPWGQILDNDSIPADIWTRMNAYRNGDLTPEQAREDYLAVLEAYASSQDGNTLSAPDADVPELLTFSQQSDSEDDFSDIDPAAVRERLQNPTPEDEARLQSMLDAAENANRQSREELAEKPDSPTSSQTGNTRPTSSAENFRITDNHLGEGGQKTKFGYNIAAIRALRQIEEENRPATKEEQETLSRYVGWGNLSQAFREGQKGWEREYAQLKDLLTPEEYEMARASTLNAHYTSPTVIRAIYDAVDGMGFRGGNILEPACGVGNFFGLLPENMADRSRLYGVELDSITGRIAALLYPHADIQVKGYEKTAMPDAFFDLAIGNVPFGDYPVVDARYKQNFSIHDYFFAKTLDQVRPGGVVAFVTSKYTMDKRDSTVRRYIAQRADLLGAIRLPDTAFRKNAGTEVTADILFLQRRDRLLDIQPDWVHLGMDENDVPLNRYFLDHPEMVLGEMVFDDNMYGNKKDTTCRAIPGADLAQQLQEAVQNIRGRIEEVELDDMDEAMDQSVPADPDVRNFSYCVRDDRLYFRENSAMFPVSLPAATEGRVRGMAALRDCVHRLIDLQLEDYGDAQIEEKQAELNTLYDRFTKEYGLINSTANDRAFRADSAYYLLCSLEILDENGNLERKADMFTKRTIKQKTAVTSVETASEALMVSIGEKAGVDLGFMYNLSGIPHEQLIRDLEGAIFRVPASDADANELIDARWQTADEYLSGNIREKLSAAKHFAARYPGLFEHNVRALEQAMPVDLEAGEISVRLGSTWVDKEYIQQFMEELLQVPVYQRGSHTVNYLDYTGEWKIKGSGRNLHGNIAASVTYGTTRMNAYQIIEDTLNLRDVRVYDTIHEDGKDKRVLNKKETDIARQKQEDIKRAFGDWVWKDPQRRQALTRLFNDRFNATRPREYDGSHIVFSGISPDISLRPHQLNAIAHQLYGGNTLLAHEVGAGKTFEMVAAAMEGKRLGLCQKSMFAVPNHLTEQWAAEFLRLYPAANILVVTKKDFEMRNRKKFCAKIATGDYDAVIIGHSQLEKIPISAERQERLLREQLWDVLEAIEQLKEEDGERFTIKQMEKTRKSLEARLEKLTLGKGRDDVVTFEQLGVDRLFVDEAHGFKNLFLLTKMRNVAGLSTSEAQKSSDLFLKCRYMDELTSGKGVIFATGTPVSNSMTELYTMQRYLQYDALAEKGLTHFDAWASTFGETVTAIELAPEGTGYRARTRFSKFHNLPELMSMFKEVADIKTADELNLPTPTANFETIVVQPSEIQKDMVQDLSQRAAIVHGGGVDPSVDNMLKITSDGRKIGLDQRLINPLLPDDPGSKVNACMGNIHRIWEESKTDRLTQLVFCDFSTPNKDGRFNVYDDIRAKLLESGIPEEEIAFIHDANTEARKKELFAKVRQGKVRVLFGSTAKMGAGTNVQDRLVAIHDLDCPWRPADLEQRKGRIVRQGNQNKEVFIYRYVTEGTFDAYLYQTVENKQKFIAQIMTSKSPARTCEDVDETALSYAEIKALCAGNPLIKEKIDLDIEVARLRLLKTDYRNTHHRLEDNVLTHLPQRIAQAERLIAGTEQDILVYNQNLPPMPEPVPAAEGKEAEQPVRPFPPMTVLGEIHAEKEAAGKALIDACKTVTGGEPVKIGAYMGFPMLLTFDSFNKKYSLNLKGAADHKVELGIDTFGNLTRINNALRSMPDNLKTAQSNLENYHRQMEDAQVELAKPFPQEQLLAEKESRLALVNAELDMDNTPSRQEEAEQPPRAASFKRPRPSILEGLRSFQTDSRPQRPAKAPGADISI